MDNSESVLLFSLPQFIYILLQLNVSLVYWIVSWFLLYEADERCIYHSMNRSIVLGSYMILLTFLSLIVAIIFRFRFFLFCWYIPNVMLMFVVKYLIFFAQNNPPKIRQSFTNLYPVMISNIFSYTLFF